MWRCLLLLAACLLALAAEASPPATSPTQPEPAILLTTSSSAVSTAGKTAYETFYLYGAPGSNEGTFESTSGLPDPQGWVGVDLTDHLDYWQVSTFNAENLNAHGAGNHAMWAGRTAAQEPAWFNAPGYGNDWDEELRWQGTAPNSAVDTDVTWEFWFNTDTEAGYDFFHVEWNSSGGWVSLLEIDGNNAPFDPPGQHFLQTWTVPSAAYVGPGADQIQLRLRFSSDGAVSNEDGLGFATAGAVQVDDISVAFDGSDMGFADFETGGSDGGWTPAYDIAGDFSKIFDRLTDLDPCKNNVSPQFTFIDDGTPPNNAPGESTGGALNPMWNYGTPGGWIVNDDGGLRADGSRLKNEIWSPAIEWDQPGTADDGSDVRTWLAYDVYVHKPGYTGYPVDGYRVRASLDGGSSWEVWSWPQLTYRVSSDPEYLRRTHELSEWIPAGTTHVQIALRCEPQTTPAPFYDNVTLWKERSGPVIQIKLDELLEDGFSPSGSVDVSSAAARDALDIPTSRYGKSGQRWPLRATIRPVDPNEVLDINRLEMIWILEKNPLFEDAIRQLPAGSAVLGPSARGWVEVTGSVTAVSAGLGFTDIYDFPLPDMDFLYPGDVLRYYLRAEDGNGLISTLPEDIGGFLGNEGFDRRFVVRGLPTLTSPTGEQPSILFVDYSQNSNAQPYVVDMAQAGFHEGVDFDTYHPRFELYLPDGSGVGAGGYQGATSGQLVGYSRIIFAGRTSRMDIDDVQTLEGWRVEPGDHLTAFFFDDLQNVSLTSYYLDQLLTQLGVDHLDGDVSDEIDGQRNPVVLPVSASFALSFELLGLCPTSRLFDSIAPRTGAVVGHGYAMLASPGNAYPGIAASVVRDRLDGQGDHIVDVTFPFELEILRTVQGGGAGGRTAASRLLEEVLGLLGDPGAGAPTAAQPVGTPGIRDLRAVPSPFNPRTTIAFELGSAGSVRLRIFDLRGRLVRELVHETLSAGRHRREWEGLDDRGHRAASGVYVVQLDAAGFVEQRKIALVK